MSYISLAPDDISTKDLHQFVIGAVSPRPIALVSTINNEGQTNLAPFSFFNAFSSNPPVAVFSANTRPGLHPSKDTLVNVREHKECVINMVDYNMHRQMSICSVEFDPGVSEFDKSGLTPTQSDIVRPFRVSQSPVQFECTVGDIIALGSHAGAANLVICNIIKMHIKSNVMDSQMRRIDPVKLDVVGRLGRSNYVRVNNKNLFSVYQAVRPVCVGYDALPKSLAHSRFFTGNDLGKFAALYALPTAFEVRSYASTKNIPMHKDEAFYYRRSKELLDTGDAEAAIKVALIPEFNQ